MQQSQLEESYFVNGHLQNGVMLTSKNVDTIVNIFSGIRIAR